MRQAGRADERVTGMSTQGKGKGTDQKEKSREKGDRDQQDHAGRADERGMESEGERK